MRLLFEKFLDFLVLLNSLIDRQKLRCSGVPYNIIFLPLLLAMHLRKGVKPKKRKLLFFNMDCKNLAFMIVTCIRHNWCLI